MYISCGTVLFRQHPLERALEAIRQVGFEYVETQAVGPWCPHVNIEKDDPTNFADLIKRHGFQGVTALWMPNGAILTSDQCVESGKRALEWAAAAGIPVVNTGDGYKPAGMSDDDAFQRYADRMEAILETAQASRTVIAIEPHGTFSLTGKGLTRLLSLSQSKWLGVNYDACNIYRAGYIESQGDGYAWKRVGQGESEVDVLEAIADRVVHVHAKDYRDDACAPLGEGMVDVAGCLKTLEKHGYSGAVSLETEGDEPFEVAVEFAQKGYAFLKGKGVGI